MYIPGIATEGAQIWGDGSGAALAILDPQAVWTGQVGWSEEPRSSEDLTIWKQIITKAYQ